MSKMDMEEIRNTVFETKKREYLYTCAYAFVCSVVIVVAGFLFSMMIGTTVLLGASIISSVFGIYGGFKFNQYLIVRTVEELVYYNE